LKNLKDAGSKKSKPKLTDAEQVELYMDKLEHPLKKEIEAVRKIIKDASNKITERIKWNAPSYFYQEDMVTFHVRPNHHVHLVFHHSENVNIKSALPEGDYKDRRMIYLRNMQEIKKHKKELQQIISQLINFIGNHNQ
jgi:uncharacterized protein YdhG (YjbR/CyaY superfamily)